VAGPVRSYYSKAFAWLGQCSLETFTLQFHLFLAADTKGVLLLDQFRGDGTLLNDRWRDLVLIVPVFLWLSWRVASATSDMVKPFTDKGLSGDELDDTEKAVGIERPLVSSSLSRNSYAARIARLVPRSKSLINDLRVRVAALLGLMWLLNLVR
jgi:hypothetical protein